MRYEFEHEIFNPAEKLTTAITNQLAPHVEAARSAYQKFHERFRGDFSVWDQLAILFRLEEAVFKTLVVHALGQFSDINAYRASIGWNGGAAEMAVWYARYVHREAQQPRITFLAKRLTQRSTHLLNDAEKLWHDRGVVPEGWEDFLHGVPDHNQEDPGIAPEAEPESQRSVTAGCVDEDAANVRAGDPVDRNNNSVLVDNFIQLCLDETTRKHIWRAAGYTQRSDFDRWQAADSRTTEAADRSFRRILTMPPRDFIALLKKQRLIS